MCKNIRKHTITNIHRGKKEDGRYHILYAELRDEKGYILTVATLDYIYEQIKELTLEN